MRHIIFVCVLSLSLAACATSDALAPSGAELQAMGSGSDDLDLGTPPTGEMPVGTPDAIGSPDGDPVVPVTTSPVEIPGTYVEEDPPQPTEPPANPPPAGEPEVVIEVTPEEVAPDAYAGDTIVRAPSAGNCCKKAAGSCCECCDPAWPCWYLEVRTELLPGIGVGVNYGRRWTRVMGGTAYFEGGVSFQDLWEPFTGEEEAGHWWQVRAGVKIEHACDYCERFQPYVRFGLAYMNLTGELEDIKQDTFNFDEDGSYFGGYAAVGLNLSLGRKIRMGPEIGVSGGWGNGDFGWTPQFSWNLSIDF